MSPRPAIFISAVSCELRSARQLVANTLTFLGYEPEWQDIFGTEEGDLRAMLRRRIDASKGLVQLLGKCYGAEPPSIDEQFGRVSYTQFEALYAKAKGKKVWYLFLDDSFPTDQHQEEGSEKRKLQTNYRSQIKAETHLFHPLSSTEGLEASVLKLRDDLTRLRRGIRRWSAFVGVLLVLSVGLSVWLLESQRGSKKQLKAVEEKLEKLQQGINSFAEMQNKVRQEQPDQKPEQLEQRTYEELAKELGIDAGKLREQLPRFAEEVKKSPNATTYERANAAYVAKDYNEAERLALAAADQARRANPPKNAEAIKAFELTAWAAEKRIEYADALKQLKAAEVLTDRIRDAGEWARVQFAIAWVLNDQGRYNDAARILNEVLKEREQLLGPEHPDTLATRRRLAIALVNQGRQGEAETEFRTLISLEEKVLGIEHPETLAARNGLANALYRGGKFAEAETEYRAVIKLSEKVLGSEHPDTLNTRMNLASDLYSQGKYTEAETEHRDVIRLKEKMLGLEHPDTLASRQNLASVLDAQGKYAEAESEYRSVIALLEKVLGPEHPNTLVARSNLAVVFYEQGKYAEAETEYREVIKLEQKVFGPEHPGTLGARNNLAGVLDAEGKLAEAETEDRTVIQLKEKALGPEHPDTLATRTDLAGVLDHQGRYAEAESEYRAVVQLKEKVVGPEHPDTLVTCNGLAKVLTDEGKYTEGEAEYRAVLRLEEKVLGPEHPETLSTCFNLALCLRSERQISEASSFAQRAADGARKVLGTDHPDTKKYEQLERELLAKEG
jgi:tetratricopeptide (TPR) repeat protein